MQHSYIFPGVVMQLLIYFISKEIFIKIFFFGIVYIFIRCNPAQRPTREECIGKLKKTAVLLIMDVQNTDGSPETIEKKKRSAEDLILLDYLLCQQYKKKK